MAGEHIKDYLPFDVRDVRMLLEDGVGEINGCSGRFGDVDFFSDTPFYPPFEYQISAKKIFEAGEDAQRIVSLLALANGLTHHSKWNGQDSDKMIKVKKMVDTMLMSVEYALKL